MTNEDMNRGGVEQKISQDVCVQRISQQTTESCKKVTAHIERLLTDCPSADHTNPSRHLIVVRGPKVLS